MNNISIITICFNNLEELKATCASVEQQAELPYEHLIIDGSTKNDIKTYLESTAQPAYRKWICEPDKGIADAFNKGIRNAKGTITTLLNSGDKLYDNTVVQRVAATFAKNSSLMWTNGLLNTYRGGIWSIVGKAFEKDKLYRGMHGVFHPTMYVKKEVYDRKGFFSLEKKIAMDYDFLCRIADEKNQFIEYPLATFDPTGVSTVHYLKGVKECKESYEQYYGSSLQLTLWQWRLHFLHYLMQTPVGKLLYQLKAKTGRLKH